ncbi:MAG: hypothetical protein K2G74_07905, partial [Muribaculaceae bacterium]|nr:hypothetical protein [Muribaculaceae bacterium]
RMRKRREAKKAREEHEAMEKARQAEEAKQEIHQTEQTAPTQNVFKSIDYAAHPEMFIIDGFIKYIIATGDTKLTSILPVNMTIPTLESALHKCFTTGQRYSSISRLTSTLRSQFRHVIKQIS